MRDFVHLHKSAGIWGFRLSCRRSRVYGRPMNNYLMFILALIGWVFATHRLIGAWRAL
jgi:hypothetical protein